MASRRRGVDGAGTNAAVGRPRVIVTLELQLVELAITAASIVIALHLSGNGSAFLLGAGACTGALALLTRGPFGVVPRIGPGRNVFLLALIGLGMVAVPIAFRSARSLGDVASLEGGGVVVAVTLLRIVRRIRDFGIAAVASGIGRPGTHPPDGDTPGAGRRVITVEGRSAFRAAGRLVGTAGTTVANEVPRSAHRMGRFVGARRARRSGAPHS
jgi:hypothetical protein